MIAKNINPAVRDREIFIAGNSGGDAFGITFNFGLTIENQTGQDYGINQDQEMLVIPVDGGKRGMFTAYNTNEFTNNKAFTSAGVNVKGANYPSGFGLMPIGAMTAGINDNATSIPTTYMGTVVNMTSFRESSLNEIKTQQDVLGNPDADGGYTGPSGITGTSSMRVVGLLNSIMGSKNLPSIFGGTTLELSYQEVTEDEEGNEVIQYKNIERDDIATRSDITENALPASRVESGEDKIVFLFSAENDHDGRC